MSAKTETIYDRMLKYMDQQQKQNTNSSGGTPVELASAIITSTAILAAARMICLAIEESYV